MNYIKFMKKTNLLLLITLTDKERLVDGSIAKPRQQQTLILSTNLPTATLISVCRSSSHLPSVATRTTQTTQRTTLQ